MAIVPRWTAAAWGAVATTTLFLAITCWWLTQDRSIPVFDAGLHLSLAFEVHSEFAAGRVASALTLTKPYPPLAYLVGALGITIGGVNVAAPIVAENFVFVPLLALGCYHVGRLAFNRTAGLLSVIFALGSPLIMAQFHVFMVDAPETAMVAVSLWAVLATDGFSRVGVSAVAGLAVGLGLLCKEPFAFYLAGPVIVTAIRGGVGSWRGVLVFALVALIVALPWYAHELSSVKAVESGAVNTAGRPEYPNDTAPARYSLDNFEWYLWNFVNFQLYFPLFLFTAVGWVWAITGLVRRRMLGRFAPELVLGAFIAWLAITETFTHDTRYSMPLLVYLAVFGAGWITHLPRRWSIIAATALVIVAVANTAGINFEAGKTIRVVLTGARPNARQHPGFVTFYSSEGFLAGAPKRDGNIVATLAALRRAGVTTLVFKEASLFEPDFSEAGMAALADVAGLKTEIWAGGSTQRLTSQYAILGHAAIEPGAPPPCVRLSDGTGVWIGLGNPEAKGARFFCPIRYPQFYNP